MRPLTHIIQLNSSGQNFVQKFNPLQFCHALPEQGKSIPAPTTVRKKSPTFPFEEASCLQSVFGRVWNCGDPAELDNAALTIPSVAFLSYKLPHPAPQACQPDPQQRNNNPQQLSHHCLLDTVVKDMIVIKQTRALLVKTFFGGVGE